MKQILEDFVEINKDKYIFCDSTSIKVFQGYSCMEMLIELTKYLGERGADDIDLLLDGVYIDGEDIVRFPFLQG